MFRWDDCVEIHIFVGFILSIVSFILLTLTAFSTPYIKNVFYLSTPDGVRYGSFGYCEHGSDGCIPHTIGYDHGPEVVEWLTRTHILFGIAALFMFLSIIALILSLLRVGEFMWNPIYFRSTALLGTALAIFAIVFALILWVTARHRYDAEGVRAKYGAALWLGLAGTITGFLSACVGGPAYMGNYMYRANRHVAYNV